MAQNAERLKKWLTIARKKEKKELLEKTGTSMSYFSRIFNGKRDFSAAMAAKIEVAAGEIRDKAKHWLPAISRKDICPVCRDCPYKARARPRKSLVEKKLALADSQEPKS